MAWYDDGGERVKQPPDCHVCGEPVLGAAARGHGERFFHGACYAAHSAAAWATTRASGIGAYSHDERVSDGLEKP